MLDLGRTAITPGRGALAPVRRPRRPSLSHEQFLAKALDLFLEDGFERASIDRIAAAAGIAKRTLYQRYGDKRSLFLAAVHRAIEDWIVPVERLRAAETDDLEDSLVAIGRILVANILKPAGLRLLRLTNAESVRMPEIGPFTIHQGTDRTLAYLADLFARRFGLGHEDAVLAGDAAEAFLHLVVGSPANAAAWGMPQDQAVLDRRIALSVGIFLRGFSHPSQRAGLNAAQVELDTRYRKLDRIIADTAARLTELRQEPVSHHPAKPRQDEASS